MLPTPPGVSHLFTRPASFCRMFTVTKATEKALLQHFIYQKLEIAYAIHKPFPFFEALRDNNFITERVYRESLEACRNLVPMSRVVHNVLTRLEKTFGLSLLMTLFSQRNLREYPDLMVIFRSFGSVVASYEHWSRTTPSGLVEGSSPQTPQLPAPHPPSLSSLLCMPGVSELQAASEQINKILQERPSSSHPALPLPGPIQEAQNNPGRKRKKCIWPTPKKKSCPKEALSPEQGIQEELQVVNQGTPRRDDFTQDLNVLDRLQEAKTDRAQTPTAEETSHETSEKNEGTTPQKTPSTPPRTTHGKDLGLHASELTHQKPQSGLLYLKSSFVKLVSLSSLPWKQEGRMPAGGRKLHKPLLAWAASSGRGVQEKVRVVEQDTTRKDDSHSTGDSKMHGAPKSSAEEQRDEDAVDFLAPTLPVTCGDARGVLYKEKMQQGSSEKCIQNEEGVWLTPDEFVIEGKRKKSKDWKKSVRCRGQTLRCLMEKKLLFCPSKVTIKRKAARR
ncbi:sp110 nuclear body protein-like [Perognathus longimembris pacificus]|uniref:sp110 nuclear body protein-like n=1 Tax=Perognathus longimembris pacificus TaxID=214514 RepID=UPI0020185C17|nr:sp110 nuclear body protein-like [Perognathus longimembris pacificus]